MNISCMGDICNLLAEVTCYHRTTTDFFTGYNPPYHRHDVYEIYLFIRGNAIMYIEQNCYKFSPGDFIIIGPDKLHRNIVNDNTPYERIGIYFSENILNTLSSEQTDLADLFKLRSHDNSGIIRLSSLNLKEYISITDRYIRNRESGEMRAINIADYRPHEMVVSRAFISDPLCLALEEAGARIVYNR